MNQKEAVFQAVNGVLAEHGLSTEGNISSSITKELRSQIVAVLVAGFQNNTIAISENFDRSKIETYASSLLSNWLRKDGRLNGGIKYVAKNPGSRAGSGDEQLKAMRQLLKTLTPGTADHTEVQGFINERVAEISVAKAPKFDLSKLPEALRNKFSK